MDGADAARGARARAQLRGAGLRRAGDERGPPEDPAAASEGRRHARAPRTSCGVFNEVHLYIEVFLMKCTDIRGCFTEVHHLMVHPDIRGCFTEVQHLMVHHLMLRHLTKSEGLQKTPRPPPKAPRTWGSIAGMGMTGCPSWRNGV